MNEQLDRMELKLAELEGKIEATYQSSEKMRKYFLWTGIITVAVILIPLFILPFVLPSFFSGEGIDPQMLQGL
jgi:hypothetical protein